MQHGIWNPYNTKRERGLIRNYYSKFTRAFIAKGNYDMISKIGNKFYSVNGTTQIDYLLNNPNFYQKKEDEKSILFLTNTKLDFLSEYHSVMKFLVNFIDQNGYKLYIKVKRVETLNKFNGLYKNNKNITFIDDSSKIVYNYYFCDIILVQSCGTSLIEAMLINKPVILCQISHHVDYMDIKKFKHIPQANNIGDLEKIITSMAKDNSIIESPEYIEEREQFLNRIVGDIENCTQKITKIIIEDYYNKHKKK